MKIQKNEGITLIALVITIIVLLILAGVSIAMLTGDNGILNQATNAKKETSISEQREELRLKEQEIYIQNQIEKADGTAKTEFTSNEAEKAGWTIDASGKITGYEGTAEIVYVPTKVNGVNITEMASNLMSGTSTVKKLVIPGQIQTISGVSCGNCANLETVILNEGVTKIGTYAFNGSFKCEYISLPTTLKEISTYGLASCGIKSVVIPKSVTTVGAGIFAWCNKPITIHCEAEESSEKENMPAGEQYNWSENWLKDAPEGTIVDWGYTK